MQHHGSKYFARTPPPPPRPWGGSIGQISTFSELAMLHIKLKATWYKTLIVYVVKLKITTLPFDMSSMSSL